MIHSSAECSELPNNHFLAACSDAPPRAPHAACIPPASAVITCRLPEVPGQAPTNAAPREHKGFLSDALSLEQFSSPSILGSAPGSLYLGLETSTSESGPSPGSHSSLVAGSLGPRWTSADGRHTGAPDPGHPLIPSSLRPPSGQEPEAGGAGHVPAKGVQRGILRILYLPESR